jgi:hypothetical protein
MKMAGQLVLEKLMGSLEVVLKVIRLAEVVDQRIVQAVKSLVGVNVINFYFFSNDGAENNQVTMLENFFLRHKLRG